MAIKICRAFFDKNSANKIRLYELGYIFIKLPRPFITVLNNNQGFGEIKGTVKKNGENYSPVSVCVFNRLSRQFLWEIKSKADGTYAFRNIAVGLECFVVAFDPNNQYNAVISDKVVAK